MKKKTTPLGLVGLYFIQRGPPGFHGQVAAEAHGPWVTCFVCSWKTHKPDAARVFNGEDLRAFDFYDTKTAWDKAVSEVGVMNKNKKPPVTQ